MTHRKSQRPLIYLIAALLAAAGACRQGTPDIEVFSEQLETHIRTLSSPAFEGRAPASPGGRLTVEYLEQAFRDAGLQPANQGSYRQAVPLIEVNGYGHTALRLSGGDRELDFKLPDQVVVNSFTPLEHLRLENSGVVFAGYGIVAPEFGWNDYEGLDVTGKTVVVLVNDPGFATQDETLFHGTAMTYYGRWTYKFEEAARQGAAAALIVHQTGPAGYGWDVVRNSWTGPQYDIDNGEERRLLMEGWLHRDAAAEVFKAAGTSLEEAAARAAGRGFRAEAWSLKAGMEFSNRIVRQTCYNVAGYLEGSLYPEESFLYMAHWDHLGRKDREDGSPVIYHGAMDNATGTAALIAMAERFAALPSRPERSVVFMAVTAEESGLIGSGFYAENPLFPLDKTIGGINMDGMNVYGPTSDLEVVGYGLSGMDEVLARHAEKQGRRIRPDQEPEKGYYFRSDHFPLARQGVPVIFANAGQEYIGKESGYADWVRTDRDARYHDPSDVVHEKWDFDGIYQDLWLFFDIGRDLANSREVPQWKEGAGISSP